MQVSDCPFISEAESQWKWIRVSWQSNVCQSLRWMKIREARRKAGGGKVIFTTTPLMASLCSYALYAQTFWEGCCVLIRTVVCVHIVFVWKIDAGLSTCQAASDQTHAERGRRGRRWRREGECEKEQMPQIEMSINNATFADLTIEEQQEQMKEREGARIGKKRLRLVWTSDVG